jgi:hypothetical protein
MKFYVQIKILNESVHGHGGHDDHGDHDHCDRVYEILS